MPLFNVRIMEFDFDNEVLHATVIDINEEDASEAIADYLNDVALREGYESWREYYTEEGLCFQSRIKRSVCGTPKWEIFNSDI